MHGCLELNWFAAKANPNTDGKPILLVSGLQHFMLVKIDTDDDRADKTPVPK